MPGRRCRLIFHAVNGIALGHLTRQVNLARRLRSLDPSLELLFLTESAHGPLIGPEFPYVTVPLGQQLQGPAWSGRQAGRRRGTLVAAIDAILVEFSPGAVVHDLFAWRPLFELAEARKIKQAVVIREHRDLERHLATRETAAHRSDLVIFPHEQDRCAEFSRLMCLGSPPAVCVGPLARHASPESESLRTRLDVKTGDTLVVVTAGGGGFPDAAAFYDLALQALSRVAPRVRGLRVQLVLGPGYQGPSPVIRDVQTQVWGAVHNLPDMLAAADLVICQAGYNTIGELAAAGTASIVLPGQRSRDNQEKRAMEASQALPNSRTLLEPTPESLASAILDALAAGHTPGAARPGPAGDDDRYSPALQRILDLAAVGADRPRTRRPWFLQRRT